MLYVSFSVLFLLPHVEVDLPGARATTSTTLAFSPCSSTFQCLLSNADCIHMNLNKGHQSSLTALRNVLIEKRSYALG
jgi:hypothetical protein